jgi:hypothetical protein
LAMCLFSCSPTRTLRAHTNTFNAPVIDSSVLTSFNISFLSIMNRCVLLPSIQ